MEYGDDELTHDFSAVENFEIDLSDLPIETQMASVVSAQKEDMASEIADELRDQEVIYRLAQWLLNEKFMDDDGNRKFHLFPALRHIAEVFYTTKIRIADPMDSAKWQQLWASPLVYKKALF